MWCRAVRRRARALQSACSDHWDLVALVDDENNFKINPNPSPSLKHQDPFLFLLPLSSLFFLICLFLLFMSPLLWAPTFLLTFSFNFSDISDLKQELMCQNPMREVYSYCIFGLFFLWGEMGALWSSEWYLGFQMFPLTTVPLVHHLSRAHTLWKLPICL